MKGKVLWYNMEKGYGVIVSEEGDSFYAHNSEIGLKKTRKGKQQKLKENSSVNFEPDFESFEFDFPRAIKIAEV